MALDDSLAPPAAVAPTAGIERRGRPPPRQSMAELSRDRGESHGKAMEAAASWDANITSPSGKFDEHR